MIAKMPIAEMRMLIDRLYTFRHPAPDLTAALGRIANEDQNLCIEVAGGSAAAGTPLQLAACNGSNAQNWSYNRQTGQIVNPALGTCIDVATGNPLPNATVHSWPCSGVAGDPPQATNPNQVWSYDPENKQLHSVFGTVLKADFIGAGAPMKTFLNVLPFTVVPSVPFGSPTPSVTVQPQQERWVADEHNRKDFNGDLHTDVLWHNPTTGNLSAWFLDGTTVLGDGALSWAVPESTGLQVKGTGDFNGDGQTDVLWHNPGTDSSVSGP